MTDFLQAEGVRAEFLPDCGFLTGLEITDQGHQIAPLHTAPWLGEPMPDGVSPHLARLQGDFFCAPFGDASADGAPSHGWPANGLWQVETSSPGHLRARLTHKVHGASVTKEVTVADGHPFLYQRHAFIGGQGAFSAGSHAMVAVRNGALISMSAKRLFRTPQNPQEADPARGRSILAYPARATDPTTFPRFGGGTVDLLTYPWAPAHEDFCMALEAETSPLGWTAVVRPVEGDVYLSLRNPRTLPATMLWHSNAGRDYAPWSGRHRGCLGVEEALPGALLGADDPDGATLNLRPNGSVEVSHAIGAVHWPSGERVATVRLDGDTLTLTGTAGARRVVPFRAAHLFG